MADCRPFFSLLLLLAAFVIRLPYYIEMPGTAEDIRSVMTVDGKMDTKSGSYDFVTVAVKEATPADLIYAWVTPFTDIHSEQEMTGGSSSEEFFRINQFLYGDLSKYCQIPRIKNGWKRDRDGILGCLRHGSHGGFYF